MQKNLLDRIDYLEDLRKLPIEQLPQVAQEIRRFIIQAVATKEGHLGASLGVVELTIALHYHYNTPNDILVWDVGHQAYGHKILTGRKKQFHTNRQLNGISGFPSRKESKYDAFGTGHSSTSISACLGMAMAAQLQNKTKEHVAIIGDASIVSGMAMEALNHLGATQTDMLVILNDNEIGIDPSVGALKNAFAKAHASQETLSQFFEALGIQYFGPIDGHDLSVLLKTLGKLKKHPGPKLLHVLTTKGKGLKQAEENQVAYHAPGKFDATTGDLILKNTNGLPAKYQDVFGWTLVELAEQNERIIGITPAMPTGSSLKYMMAKFPDRAIDVGIAEQHAVTLAAGMATEGLRVYCTIYSTFLQRAYDQVIHDVCLQKLPVVFCIDRAGLVGEDGATHHGIFDIAYLKCIPNLLVFAASDLVSLRQILYTAEDYTKGPIAIRYPRGRGKASKWQVPFSRIEIGKGIEVKEGTDTAILCVGPTLHHAMEAINTYEHPVKIGCFDLRFIKPMDYELLHKVFKQYKHVITIEDGVLEGGVGQAIQAFAYQHKYTAPIQSLGIPDEFPSHASIEELEKLVGISSNDILNALRSTD